MTSREIAVLTAVALSSVVILSALAVGAVLYLVERGDAGTGQVVIVLAFIAPTIAAILAWVRTEVSIQRTERLEHTIERAIDESNDDTGQRRTGRPGSQQ